MNQAVQLPAHLRALATLPSLADHAAEGIGSSLPPHISIQGNQFALIDATGAAHEIETTHLDVCIIDRSDVICKSFYAEKWSPDSSDPPACFSMNGIGPSTESSSPQARTCAECPNNVRGSAMSAMSNKPIKACRDEIKLAVIVPGYDMLFQFTLTPGSFTNWRSYVQKFKGQQFDIKHVMTRLTFERGKSGVLEFNVRPYVQGGPAPWIDEPTAQTQLKALTAGSAGKATDLIVGRTDRPRGGELPPPPAQAQIAAPSHQTAPEFQAQAALAMPSPAAETAPTGRRRRTKAEMEAAKTGVAPQQPGGLQTSPGQIMPQTPPTAQPQGFQPAPFRPAEPQAQAPFAQPAPQGAPFGIGNPQTAPSDWSAELDAMFPKT